ncbi:hypothetical protein G647_05479 [Cladophialophora carrionii CBS 160.54]|uniref:Uncharacterized protein n=1 Tax=Cladophialophora carrionii CBS 160.54 TaxID=1279043 RepID=V9DAF3_9EURO|nr:uncharacterized protein G647_05479 [Cladophialophora carrionii CBS 160.54]ETI23676.1 hypothetical protein G647_05479 [Cladophialophora carrionii CBS 160.54]
MEDGRRPFESVKVGLASAETGQERFTRDGVYAPPPLAAWRCNLTALSQRFNLYFAATTDTIAVYRPDFPFQKLYRLPALLIPPAPANPTARGYIDPRVPHAVNHLIVGDLGKEEILLTATDSGNITAYYTKTIDEAIRKDPYRFSTDARSDYIGVRPFFTHWVDESAWGLAIHSNARMIAVSANTPHNTPSDDPCAKVTVFAFALTEDSHGSGAADKPEGEGQAYLEERDWEEWVAMGVAATTPARKRNYKITLAGVEGHDHHIPCISFVNSDDDLEGNWLLSTDIGGNLKIWQIWQGICQKSWVFAETTAGPDFLIPRQRHRSRERNWFVAALDPRSFRSAKTMEQFCGHSNTARYHGHNNLESYDLTAVVRIRARGNSHAHPLMQESTEDETDVDDNIETPDSWSDLDEAAVAVNQGQYNLDLATDHGQATGAGPSAYGSGAGDILEQVSEPETTDSGSISPEPSTGLDHAVSADALLVEGIILEEHDDFVPDEDDESEYHSDSEQQVEDDDSSSVGHRSTTSLSSLTNPRSPEIDVDVLAASDMDSPLRARQDGQKEGQLPAFTINDSSVIKARGTASAPNIPTIHCSASNLRLLMTPQADSPHVFCANILKQILPHRLNGFHPSHIDRLNMMLQIPELGIVVVATQIGRCAICSLTRLTTTGTLGLRVDWILPTRKQELRGLRPFSPLLGIAASPVQGHFKSEKSSARRMSEETDGWGKDRVVDGVPTTFDPTVLVVEEQRGRGEHSTPDKGQNGNGHNMKRKHGSCAVSRMDPHTTKTEFRKWQIPTGAETWQAMDSSRRYRLMLTYSDMTVLTYELSRGIDGDEVAHDEPVSTLELLD